MTPEPTSTPGDPTTYFTPLAGTYSTHRPSYPREAIRCVVDSAANAPHAASPPLVADIGCGTGISTRLLAAFEAQVIGIDPNAAMLKEARAQNTSPRVWFVHAPAEHTTLPNASLDGILCAQSFHWFNQPAALKEFHRILKPGSVLALLWNVQETSDPLTAVYAEVSRCAQRNAAKQGLIVPEERTALLSASTLFAAQPLRIFANHQTLDLDGLLGRAASASYFPRDEPMRSELQTVLRDAFHAHARDGVIHLRYRCELTLAFSC